MRLLNKIVMFGAFCGLLTGCADESPWGVDSSADGKGGIKLDLTASSDVDTSIPKVRSGETYDLNTPPASKFQIRLSKVDGTYAQTWSSLEEFAKETEFSIGMYEIEAFYGEPGSQGFVNKGEAGYSHSYYYGKVEEIIVKEGEDTPVQIYAELANAAVIVEYTEEFKKYFLSWSTTLQTDGNEDVEIGDFEGLSYVTPGTVDIVMNAVLQNGNKVFLNPAAFMAEPKHLYKITYNVHGGDVEDAVLVIKFNDDPEETHDVEVPLGELTNAEAPIVTASGFVDGETIESQTGVSFPEGKQIQFNIVARGGIKSARLRVNPVNSLTSLGIPGGEIDLCQATEDQQATLTKAGIIARGLYSNRKEMANLDITDFCKSLPEGSHEISFQVTDNLDQVSGEGQPVKLTIINAKVNAEITDHKAVFGDGYVDFTVSYDGPDPTQPGENPLSFQMREPTKSNVLMPVEVISITSEGNNTRSFDKKNYIYRVSMPAEEGDYYYANLYFNGINEAIQKDYKVDLTYPDYQIEYDPFATKLRLRIAGLENEPEKRKLLTERLRVFVVDEEKSVTKDVTTGIVSFEGLESNQNYTIHTTLKKGTNSGEYQTTASVRTETELPVPNGDFSETETTLNYTGVNVGGTWLVWGFLGVGKNDHHQITSSIVREEATGWASINKKTCYKNSTNNNTWFIVPSTFIEKESEKLNVNTIRTVGYTLDGTGKVPAESGLQQYNQNYYCENTPTEDQLDKTAGELFLGTYNFDGSVEIQNEGVGFYSRPCSFSFDYSYMSYEDTDNGLVNISMLDENNNEIISETRELLSTSAWKFNSSKLPSGDYPTTTIKIDLTDYSFGMKAHTLKISFKSSSNPNNINLYIPSGNYLDEGLDANPTGGNHYLSAKDKVRAANSYHAFSMGSELKVSNLKFSYDNKLDK